MWTAVSSRVPLCADTLSPMVLWQGPACLHWSIKWAGGGQSSVLLRPLFAPTFIKLINKALCSGDVFTIPLLLLVVFITVLQTKVATGTPGSERFSQHVQKNGPPDYFHWSNSIYKMELNLIAHHIYKMIMGRLWSEWQGLFPHSLSWRQCLWASLICCVLSILFYQTIPSLVSNFLSCFASLKLSLHRGSLLLLIHLRTAELVTSGSQLSAGGDVMKTRVVGFLGGEPERSSAGKQFVWPALKAPDNEQSQQFIYVSHVWRDRHGEARIFWDQ